MSLKNEILQKQGTDNKIKPKLAMDESEAEAIERIQANKYSSDSKQARGADELDLSVKEQERLAQFRNGGKLEAELNQKLPDKEEREA